MNEVADSTVIIAALANWHSFHDVAAKRLQKISTAISHSLAETFSTLTRMPRSQRVHPMQIKLYLEIQFKTEVSSTSYLPAITELTNLGITGGATYDGLIALTARNAGMKLLSLDRRAIPTYEAVGVEFEILI